MDTYEDVGPVVHSHFVLSLPEPTPQVPAAPTLEQLAESLKIAEDWLFEYRTNLHYSEGINDRWVVKNIAEILGHE